MMWRKSAGITGALVGMAATAGAMWMVFSFIPLPPALAWDPAQTEFDCRAYAEMKAGLAQRGETPRAAGVVGPPSNGRLLMFFRSEQGSWTIIAVDRRQRIACVGSWGVQWSAGPAAIDTLMNSPIPPPPLPGSDSSPND